MNKPLSLSLSRAGIQDREPRSDWGAISWAGFGPGLIQAIAAVVADGPQLVWASVESEPLLHRELLLSTGEVGPSASDLHVVTVPPVMGTVTVGRDVNGANGTVKTGSPSAKDVEVASLEVVVTRTHQPAPSDEVLDVDVVSVLVEQLDADL